MQTFFTRVRLTVLLAAILLVSAASVCAQTTQFGALAPLAFTMTAGSNPVPQNVTVISTGAVFDFLPATKTSSGGNWLSISCSGPRYSDGYPTPSTCSVRVDAATLSAGSYSGQLTFTRQNTALTVAVALTVVPSGTPFIGTAAGALSFVSGRGYNSAAQAIPLRSTTGSNLTWSASVSMSGNVRWLSISSESGTTPSTLTVSASDQGLAPGIYLGQVLLQSSNSSVTVPVSLVVLDTTTNTFQQLPQLSFTMVAGANPVPQNLLVPSTGKDFDFLPSAQNTGNTTWLKVSCNAPRYSDGFPTPTPCTISVDAATMQAGAYGGELTLTNSGIGYTVPVLLTIIPAGSPAPAGIGGGLNFTGGNGFYSGSQVLQLNTSTGAVINWSASTSVFRLGSTGAASWLNLARGEGSTPDVLTVSASTQGLAPGIYLGQLVVRTSDTTTSIPVSLTVVDTTTSTFEQLPALSFTMTAGSSPVAQNLLVPSTGTDFDFIATASNSGNTSWLRVDCNSPRYSDGFPTPSPCFITATASTLSPGYYTGQITFASHTAFMTVPVSLAVMAPGTAYLGGTGGGLNFTAGNGFNSASKVVPIVSSGAGTLSWTATSFMFRGGSSTPNWLTVSSTSGTAPYSLTVSATPQGLAPGIYTGLVLLQAASSSVTLPVTLVVADTSTSTFQQVPGLSFTMTAGANPLPQNLTVVSTRKNFDFEAAAQATGTVAWLSVKCNAPQYSDGFPTPAPCSVSVDAATLPAGNYFGEVTLASSTDLMTVPVTLSIMPPGSASLAGVGGGLHFTAGNGYNPAPQVLPIVNTGADTLAWTASASSFRSGPSSTSWLSISSTSGTTPSTLTVSASAQDLPPGTYLGQIFLQTQGSSLTIPVSLVVADSSTSTFQQLPALAFTMVSGSNPLAQNLIVATTGDSFDFRASASSTGNVRWLTVDCNAVLYSDGYPATAPCAASVDASTLSPGFYAGEITFSSRNDVMTVPVSLTVVPAGSTGLNSVPGGLNFVSGNGTSTFSQSLRLSAAGGGSLAWTATPSVFRKLNSDASDWLSVSTTSGVTPSSLTVSASPDGLAPGIYLGQILLATPAGSVTIPVSLVIADSNVVTFKQLPVLTFSTPVGANPPNQTVTVASTGKAFDFMPKVQNTGSPTWLKASCSGPQYSDGYVSSSTCTISVSSTTLATGYYAGQVTFSNRSSAMTVPVQLTVGTPPTNVPSIAAGGIVPVASTSPVIQPGEWVTIYGNNLATGTYMWNGDFPTSLGGTSVTINGKRAYLWYVSPGQINLQVPDDNTLGVVSVVVNSPLGSTTASVTLAELSPSLLMLDSRHVTAIIFRTNGSGAFGGGTYDIVGPTGTSLGYKTVAARAGDVIALYGVGFGPTSTLVPAGQAFSGASATLNPVALTINGKSVTPAFAGISGAGLYQINFTVPANLGSGELSLQATVRGTSTQTGVVFTVQ